MKAISPITCSLFASLFFVSIATAAPSAAKAETKYVNVDGNRIAYRSIGKGTPILMANRMRGTLDTWDPLFLDELARAHGHHF